MLPAMLTQMRLTKLDVISQHITGIGKGKKSQGSCVLSQTFIIHRKVANFFDSTIYPVRLISILMFETFHHKTKYINASQDSRFSL